jgi:hypothetical protein
MGYARLLSLGDTISSWLRLHAERRMFVVPSRSPQGRSTTFRPTTSAALCDMTRHPYTYCLLAQAASRTCPTGPRNSLAHRVPSRTPSSFWERCISARLTAGGRSVDVFTRLRQDLLLFDHDSASVYSLSTVPHGLTGETTNSVSVQCSQLIWSYKIRKMKAPAS